MLQLADKEETIGEVVVEYLRHAEPSSRPSSFENALEIYISKLDKPTQNRILPGWVRLSEIYDQTIPTNSKKRKRKDSGRDEGILNEDEELQKLQQQAQVFLNHKERERAREADRKMKPVDPVTVEGAIAALFAGQEWHHGNVISDLWSSEDKAELTQSTTPIQRLTMMYNNVSSSAHSVAFKRRILISLWLHECKQNRIKINRGESKEVEEKTGLSFGKAAVVDKAARGWLRFIEAWGIGGLVMPGAGHSSVFERELSIEQVGDLWAFCDQYMPDIKRKVETMRETVLTLLVEAVKIYQGDAKTLENGQGRLANAYRANRDLVMAQSSVVAPGNAGESCLSSEICSENTALDTLAEAAHQQRLQDTDGETPTDGLCNNLLPAIDRTRVVRPTVIGTQSFTPCEAEPNAGANNQEAIYGQPLQRPWQPFDLNWSQEPVAPGAPYDGAMNPLFNGFSQDEMPNGESTMEFGSFWDDATYYDTLM